MRIAIIGFSMAGVSAAQTLRHIGSFVNNQISTLEVTVFEAASRAGGKCAPNNLGAQFLDAEDLYPMDWILGDLGLKTFPSRRDYEMVDLRRGKHLLLEAPTFVAALRKLRELLLEALQTRSLAELDSHYVEQMFDARLDAAERSAMRQRFLLEDGTTRLSALYYALSLSQARTPAARLEVQGGLYQVAEQARLRALAAGYRVCLETAIERVEVKRGRVYCWVGGERCEFDGAILALAPEHLHPKRLRLEVLLAAFGATYIPDARAHQQEQSVATLPRSGRGARL